VVRVFIRSMLLFPIANWGLRFVFYSVWARLHVVDEDTARSSTSPSSGVVEVAGEMRT
jgi:hypothetical protein